MSAGPKTMPTSPKPEDVLHAAIAEMRSHLFIRDGRLEVALAIASVSEKVKVSTANTEPLPFRTRPADLFDRTFNDAAVGVSDAEIKEFKANLAALLPEIKDRIRDGVPEHAVLPIEQVAELIRLALLAHREESNQ